MAIAQILFSQIILFGAIWKCTNSLKLPSYIKPCAKDDPKLDECALEQATKVIPRIVQGDMKYRIPVLDPLHVDEARIEQGSGSIKVTLVARNISIFGLKGTRIDKLGLDLKNRSLKIHFMVKRLSLASQYDINGQILTLPIVGHGDMNNTVDELSGIFQGYYDLIVRQSNGKEYIKLKDSTLNYNVKKAQIYMDNLFNGDKALGENMNTFLNENWEEVFKELGPVVAEIMRSVITGILDPFFSLVSYNDVFS